ncbi:membrane-associated protein, putative [Bodo saltans]|uniref:Membrane-associated protein, putative n=1 Tax=Bodo saltans TaxID=75058 RepID=A0A0S4IKH8_BODSA|nr:membrane-associated protein, putative [Bodo saltans]|eukprot:CUE66724.1 membrane-associated protein, putative [Bodo saltans]
MRRQAASAILLVFAVVAVVCSNAAAPENEDPQDKAVMDARRSQDVIDKTTEEMMRKLTELEIEFHKKKQPLFEQRNEILKTVKGFWARVVENHPSHESWFRGSDKAALAHLTDVVVKDLEEETDAHLLHHYRIELHFEPNAYFSNAVLRRDVRGHAHDDGVSTVSGVTWFEGRLPTEPSFFNFFERSNERITAPRLDTHFISEIGHIFRYEFWPNPFTYHDLPQYQELMQQHHRGDLYAAAEEHAIPYQEETDFADVPLPDVPEASSEQPEADAGDF